MNTQQLLDQTKVWLTADRMPIQLPDMDPSHRRNTLAFLRRRAGYLREAYLWCEARTFDDAPDDVFDQLMAEQDHTLTDDAADWLERRPLILELARLVADDEREGNVVDGEVVVRELPTRTVGLPAAPLALPRSAVAR